MSSDKIVFVDVGLVEYLEALKLQHELVEKRAAGKISDTVLLLEHYDVYTLGRRGLEENILDRSIPVYRVERGGDATYHGPGQLVVYPIVSLNENGLGVAEFVKLLEETCILLLADFGVDAQRVEGKPGVWVAGRKIASIGMAVKNWVTYHGLALNVNSDLAKFRGIRPCGMDPDLMTSMQQLLGRKMEMDEVKRIFTRHFSSLMGRKRPLQPLVYVGLPQDEDI
ncbi:MAG: lipoyl(octanoyl) transferase LipB [Candidatus Caldarchaeum sp.]